MSGEVVVGTDMRDLDGEAWTLRLTITNSAGSQSKSAEFELSFRDACWEAELTPATFSQSIYTFELYKDTLSMPFTSMASNRSGCGGFAY